MFDPFGIAIPCGAGSCRTDRHGIFPFWQRIQKRYLFVISFQKTDIISKNAMSFNLSLNPKSCGFPDQNGPHLCPALAISTCTSNEDLSSIHNTSNSIVESPLLSHIVIPSGQGGDLGVV